VIWLSYLKSNNEKSKNEALGMLCIKHLTCAQRLSYLNLPTLHYRRLRGDVIMVFKIVISVTDSMVSCNFIGSHSVTRENRYKLTHKYVHYNLTKFLFAD